MPQPRRMSRVRFSIDDDGAAEIPLPPATTTSARRDSMIGPLDIPGSPEPAAGKIPSVQRSMQRFGMDNDYSFPPPQTAYPSPPTNFHLSTQPSPIAPPPPSFDLGERRLYGSMASILNPYITHHALMEDGQAKSMSHVRYSSVPLNAHDAPFDPRRSSSSSGDTLIGSQDGSKEGEASATPKRPDLLHCGSTNFEPDDFRASAIEKAKRERRKRNTLDRNQDNVRYHVASAHVCHKFIARLARCLLAFGAPGHKMEEQLATVALFLGVKAVFIHFPNYIVVSFEDANKNSQKLLFIRQQQGLHLGKLRGTHEVYTSVVNDETSAGEGILRLREIFKEPELYSPWQKLVLAFLAGSVICVSGFQGSLCDGLISGILSMLLMCLSIWGCRSPLYVNIFEISVAIFSSFVARAFNSIHGRIFCYSAISSASIVLILPGFLVFQGSIELAAKNWLTGAIKLVHAVVYALFLGVSITIGSDLWFGIDGRFRHARDIMAADLGKNTTFVAEYISRNASSLIDSPTLNGTWIFTRPLSSTQPVREYHYQVDGCYRDPEWSWAFQSAPWWTAFFLVPIFAFCLATLNGQNWKKMHMVYMILLACISSAVNKVAAYYIPNRGDLVSSISSFAVGVIGTAIGHFFDGAAFPDMIPGILLLLPAGLSIVGGLSQNFKVASTAWVSWLSAGLGMVRVTIGISLGLISSTVLVIMGARILSKKKKVVLSF